MLEFLKQNIGTFIVGLILMAAVISIIAKLISRKKAGKCVACSYCDSCRKNCPSKQKKESSNRQA